MGNIGLYTQVTDFTCVNAGTSEWCKAEKNGRLYFVKKFLSPVYPTRELALTEDKFNKRSARFHKKFQELQQFYNELNHQNFSGVLVLPEEVISFQYHICTISPFISANIKPEQVCRLSPWQKTVILRTLTLAVMNVHQAGVVHGDLKPENVMITQNPENGSCQLKLIDFDESFYEKDPPVSFVRGDPSYFAPEAYAHEENNAIRLDHRMDIFALGIMYHFFWCGKLPGKPAGQTIGETVLRGGKITLSDEIPEELRNLIQGMMNVRPDKRPVLQFAYDFTLKKLLDSLPVQIVNLQPSVPVKKKTADIKIRCVDENGSVLRERIMKAPIGEKAIAEADEIEGYHVISLRTKEVTAGETNDTVLFTYRKDKVKKENLFGKACAVLAALFLIYWGVMYGRIEAESQAGRDRKALELMDYTPFYRLVCQDKYEKTEIRVLRAEGTLYEYYISINDGKTHTVSFQAPSDGEYIFMSTGSDDTVGYLYRDAAGSSLIDQNDDSGLSRGNNFGMTHTMKKDETVYVGVRYLASSRKGTIHLLIFRKR